jgi:hypothetical protein
MSALADARDRVAQGPRITFDHVTYLQGTSNTLFLNSNIMELFWTQIEDSRDVAGHEQGFLYGYGLEAPHRFRQGSLDFSSEVYVDEQQLCMLLFLALS